MIAITCPWCEGDAPLDPEALQAAGGSWTCPGCLVTVDLVDHAEPAMLLAA